MTLNDLVFFFLSSCFLLIVWFRCAIELKFRGVKKKNYAEKETHVRMRNSILRNVFISAIFVSKVMSRARLSLFLVTY